MSDTLFSLLLILGALLLGEAVSRITAAVIRRKKTVFIVIEARIFFEHLFRPLEVLLLAVFVFWGISFARLPQEIRGLLEYAVDLWIIGAVGWLMIKVVNAVRDLILSRYDIHAKDNLKARSISTQVRLIEHILTAVIIFFTIAFMLMILPKARQIGISLVASAGVAGIILGFAAQKTLGNFIAGIQLAFAQPIRIDDVVIVENEWGWIETITLTYVVVRVWDLRRLVVPISYFIEKPFQNWTRTSANLLGTVFLYADYTVPVNEVREELTRILNGHPLWDKKVNVLQVTNADNRTIELRALVSAADSSTAWDLRCDVREKLLEFLQKEHPQSLPRVRVDMDERMRGRLDEPPGSGLEM